ncbi:MAG: hypothetical protein HKN45_07805 [Flavobacteriales bacterium]|nr:hypothetical protein [Flavobacteriales bacterium]
MKSKSNIDFIGIGYAKSGTSYIYKQLNAHPEISLPAIKEIRYLNESWFLPRATLFNKLFSSHWHYKEYRSRLRKRLRYWAKHPTNVRHDSWHRRFLLAKHTDRWYNSLFDSERISGEITPAYVYMPEERVRELSTRFPDLKIIIMLRNPVDRTWSHIKMNLAKHKGRSVADLSEDEIYRRMKTLLDLNPPYFESVPLWKKYFKNVFVGFHDDIIARPGGLMRDLFGFLGVAEIELNDTDVKQKVNEGIKGAIPHREKEYLQTHFKDEIQNLKETTDWSYVENW